METVQRMVILPNEKIGEISPYLHGNFAEHLGELVYPGIWVGEKSPIPNTRGIRNDVVQALKPLNVPVLRWPGGCFADGYHWRDGIGPREQRPQRVNVWWGMAPEPNAFGTHEFAQFCRMIGTEPYFTANVGSGSPQELRDWAEYCNFKGRSTLADERRANGEAEPFNIRYWAIGNENWGCGGNMGPEQYAQEFCRFRTYLFNYPHAPSHAIACGPSGQDWAWSRRFFEHMRKHHWNRMGLMQSYAAHYYCGTSGTATAYTPQQWLELLARAKAVEGIIAGHRQIMDEYDPERKISLILDEWGAWHPAESGKPMSGLYQQNTMRDALACALTLDVFHNHADKIYMGNIAQLINVLQSVLLVQEDRCIKTPTYHAFDLYQPHKGGTAVRLVNGSEAISDGGAAKQACCDCWVDKHAKPLQAVHGSASVKQGVLCLTACNTHPGETIELDAQIVGGGIAEAELAALAADDIHAHNTFERPDAVRLSKPRRVQGDGGRLRVQLAPGAVVRLMGKLVG